MLCARLEECLQRHPDTRETNASISYWNENQAKICERTDGLPASISVGCNFFCKSPSIKQGMNLGSTCTCVIPSFGTHFFWRTITLGTATGKCVRKRRAEFFIKQCTCIFIVHSQVHRATLLLITNTWSVILTSGLVPRNRYSNYISQMQTSLREMTTQLIQKNLSERRTRAGFTRGWVRFQLPKICYKTWRRTLRVAMWIRSRHEIQNEMPKRW